MKKEKQYYDVDHANKQLDRLRVNPNRASVRQATQRRAVASTIPSGVADLPDETSEQDD